MATSQEGTILIQLKETRRKINQLRNSVKSNHKTVTYGKSNANFTELQGPISYAYSSKDVSSEQHLLLVVTEKKNQTNSQSLNISFGGDCVGI